MRLYRSGRGLIVEAPAKLNLFFEVLDKRTDGYHEIETLMCPIDLYDTIYVEKESHGQIRLHGIDAGAWKAGRPWLTDIPNGPQNLIVRALELFRHRVGIADGIGVRCVKRIPTAAGMGGGSSDAAAALAAANALWEAKIPKEQLAQWAAEVGSDVPFFLTGGPAICRGRGEQVQATGTLGNLHFVVVRPCEGLATAAVYKACRPAARPRSVSPFLQALRSGDPRGIRAGLYNRLEPAAQRLSPWIGRLREEMHRMNLIGHAMTGSGTAYFGWCRNAGHARAVARRLQARTLGSVFVVRSCR